MTHSAVFPMLNCAREDCRARPLLTMFSIPATAERARLMPGSQRWLRFFEQNLRVVKWELLPGLGVTPPRGWAARRSKLDRACAGQAMSEDVVRCKIPSIGR